MNKYYLFDKKGAWNEEIYALSLDEAYTFGNILSNYSIKSLGCSLIEKDLVEDTKCFIKVTLQTLALVEQLLLENSCDRSRESEHASYCDEVRRSIKSFQLKQSSLDDFEQLNRANQILSQKIEDLKKELESCIDTMVEHRHQTSSDQFLRAAECYDKLNTEFDDVYFLYSTLFESSKV